MGDEDKYFAAGVITAKLPTANASTMRHWADKGSVRVIRSAGGKRFYHIDDVKRELGFAPDEKEANNNKEVIGYARVSSSHQKADLDRQVQYIRDHYETDSIITDIGSGLNFKRRGLNTLLTRVESGSVGTVVVTYRDRLCRFGLELIERIFRTYHTELLVLNTEEGSEEQELASELLDVVNVFVARRNGRRGAQYRAERADSDQQVQVEPVEIKSTNLEKVVSRRKILIQPVHRVVSKQQRNQTNQIDTEEPVS